MLRTVARSALGSSSHVAKITTRAASTSHTSSSFASTITGPAGRRAKLEPASTSSPVTVTDSTGRPVSSTSATASKSSSEAYPGKPAALFENKQMESEKLNTKTDTIPNPRPHNVSDWVHNVVSDSKMLQAVLYGVQNPSERPGRPGLLSKLKGGSA
ncbi:hypothetical protein E2P81_ATG08263 [Venturia nashicola]|uniref:Uncharacterized protein n=1 Tax=Venturia nashicola TaxID=86259 RepID=A0A4Z1P4Q0_9PEZI|nr:hypothetical protein E6O75_ATG08443 [Venturia nashicola]TLD21675.1 hypothetical protein E2P81_ATG08263 [Venturia nashicola]